MPVPSAALLPPPAALPAHARRRWQPSWRCPTATGPPRRLLLGVVALQLGCVVGMFTAGPFWACLGWLAALVGCTVALVGIARHPTVHLTVCACRDCIGEVARRCEDSYATDRAQMLFAAPALARRLAGGPTTLVLLAARTAPDPAPTSWWVSRRPTGFRALLDRPELALQLLALDALIRSETDGPGALGVLVLPAPLADEIAGAPLPAGVTVATVPDPSALLVETCRTLGTGLDAPAALATARAVLQ